MAQLVVRNLEEDVKRRLHERAARHGRSLAAELRDILRAAAHQPPAPEEPLGTRIARRFAGIGLTEPLEEFPRQEARPAEIKD